MQQPIFQFHTFPHLPFSSLYVIGYSLSFRLCVCSDTATVLQRQLSDAVCGRFRKLDEGLFFFCRCSPFISAAPIPGSRAPEGQLASAACPSAETGSPCRGASARALLCGERASANANANLEKHRRRGGGRGGGGIVKLGHSYTLADARTSKELLLPGLSRSASLFPSLPVGGTAGGNTHGSSSTPGLAANTSYSPPEHTHKTSHICQTACPHDALADLSSPTRAELSANPHCSWICGWLEAGLRRRLFSRVHIHPKPHSSPKAWISHWPCPWRRQALNIPQAAGSCLLS